MARDPGSNREENKFLGKLLRMSQEDKKDAFTRPADATILAYMAGTASQFQKDEIMAALAASPSFRREFREIARDLLSLSEKETQQQFDRQVSPESPGLDDFLASAGARDPGRRSFWSRLWSAPWM